MDIVNVYRVKMVLSEDTLGHDNTIVTDDGVDEDDGEDEVYLGGGEQGLAGQEGEVDDGIVRVLFSRILKKNLALFILKYTTHLIINNQLRFVSDAQNMSFVHSDAQIPWAILLLSIASVTCMTIEYVDRGCDPMSCRV